MLDGLDEASSLAQTFESLGIYLAKSGNRVVMAARPEGVKSEGYYKKKGGWRVMDLRELSVKQQETIANHQIANLQGQFFDRFYEFQDRRNALDAAATACNIDLNSLASTLNEIKSATALSTMSVAAPVVMISCNTLAEVGLLFNDDDDFAHGKSANNPGYEEVFDLMKQLYDQATLAKIQFDQYLDSIAGLRLEGEAEKLDMGSIVKMPLNRPKRLLQLASRNNGIHNVTADIVQGALVCNDCKQMEMILKRVATSEAMPIHHIHNGFEDLDFIHYRSLTITILIEITMGKNEPKLVCPVKLQLHLRPIYELLSSCQTTRSFFLEQGGLCGRETHRASDIKKRMDVVYAIGRTPVLLSVFLMYIKASTSRLSEEERDEAVDVQACPPMPTSLHYMYQEALWEALVSRANNPDILLEMLQRIAFQNMKKGVLGIFSTYPASPCHKSITLYAFL